MCRMEVILCPIADSDRELFSLLGFCVILFNHYRNVLYRHVKNQRSLKKNVPKFVRESVHYSNIDVRDDTFLTYQQTKGHSKSIVITCQGMNVHKNSILGATR